MSDIAAWLDNLGLGKYNDVFAENAIDFDILSQLGEPDLKELGIAALGDRKRLLNGIATLDVEGVPAANTVSDTPISAAPKPLAERRQLTVMFVDLVGSTELSSQLDPEDMRELILAYQNAVAGEIMRFKGYVAKYMGDGVLAYFGWPRAYEDAAERAVHAALSITPTIARLPTPVDDPLQARIGIATGLVVVGDLIGEGAAQEEAVVGETPNLAARLQALAKPDTVVISDITRRLLGDVFGLRSLGAHEIKGFAEPVDAYVAVKERLAESRYQAQHAGAILPMVGRDHELAQILERWQQAYQNEGQVILLSGDAGIGKSRLLRALSDAIDKQPHHRIYYQCSPYYMDSTLYPVIQQFTRAANFINDDTAETKLDKLETLLGEVFDGYKEHAPLITALLDIDGENRYGKLNLTAQQQRIQTLQTLITYLTVLAKQQPVLLVVEDAHWIDPTTLELIDLSLDAISQSRILLLMTARPTFEHRFGGHPIVTRLSLNRLGRDLSRNIIESLGGGKHFPEALLEEIIRKTDGVPLFVEELTKTVLESEILRETDDAFVLDEPLRSLDIPNSLHDSLMARLDRFGSVKEIAQLAACIGRDFSYELIAATASQSDGELQAALAQLTEAELIFSRGTPPDSSYTFKHALIRDVAYQSLLKSKRQQIHGCIGKLLEENFAHQAATQPELLAHHYTEAGQIPEAAEYWCLAGEQALGRSAYLEALKHMQTARDVLQSLPADSSRDALELNILPYLGMAVQATDGLGSAELENVSLRRVELARKKNDKEILSSALSSLAGCWVSCSQARKALAVSQELITLVENLDKPEMTANAHRSAATAHYYLGEFTDAVRHCRLSVSLADHHRIPTEATSLPLKQVSVFLSRSLWYLGYPDQALQIALQFQRDATQGSPESAYAWFHAWGYTATTRVHLYRRDHAAMLQEAEALQKLSTRYGLATRKGQAEVMIGIATAYLGKPLEAIQLIEEGIHVWRATGTTTHLPDFLAHLALAYGRINDFDKGLSILNEALGRAENTDERHHEAEIRRIKGELLLQRNKLTDLTDAEACFQQSLQVARLQQAKSWELRTATSLARLWRDESKRGEAYELLAPVYNWFTEGFDTADLKDAKALLDELT